MVCVDAPLCFFFTILPTLHAINWYNTLSHMVIDVGIVVNVVVDDVAVTVEEHQHEYL